MNYNEFRNNLLEEEMCKEYRVKFINKYSVYCEERNSIEAQFRYDNHMEDAEYYGSGFSEKLDYEWDYLGSGIEDVFSAIDADFSILSNEKRFTLDDDSDVLSKNYIIYDAWKEMIALKDDVKFCYGIYKLTDLLSENKKQVKLKEAFGELLNEILNIRIDRTIPIESAISKYIKQNNGVSTCFGKMEIIIANNRLGQGGNGVVYSGKINKSEIAIKFLLGKSNSKLLRFKAEYINVSILKEKLVNTVNCLHYEELVIDDIVIPCILMKKYKCNLKKERQESTLTWEKFEHLYKDISRAIKSMEHAEIIHRDLKPENILVDNSDNYYITDFGIAHFSNEDALIKGLTKKGERLANFAFAAPEQINNKDVTYATDIYAFGQLLYWYAFGEVNRGTGGRKITEVFGDKASVKWYDKVISKCIANNPKNRYQSIEEIENDWKIWQSNDRKINLYDDMYMFSEIIRSIVPECYNNVWSCEEDKEIERLLIELSNAKFNRQMDYNTGLANNHISKIPKLENGNYLINNREISIDKVWCYTTSSVYNDLLIIEISNPEPYKVEGKDCFGIAIIDDDFTVSIEKIDSGYIRVPNGDVRSTSELNIERRYIYADDQEKYMTIGVFNHCSIIGKNDKFIDELQKNDKLDKKLILEFHKKISKNKTYDVELGL